MNLIAWPQRFADDLLAAYARWSTRRRQMHLRAWAKRNRVLLPKPDPRQIVQNWREPPCH